MQDRIFYSTCFGFLFGILSRSFLLVNLYFLILFGLVAFALFIIFTFIRHNKWATIFLLFVLSFCFGIFRFHMVDESAPEVFESWVGQSNTFSGTIVDEPNIKPTNQQLTVEIQDDAVKTKILVSEGLDKTFKYGDEVKFTGKLKKPDNFVTDQGKVFDYVNYLRKDGILYLMSYPKIVVVSGGHGNKLKSVLFTAKEKFLDEINFLIPSPDSLLMGGLILGEKSEFDQTLRQSFVNTGTIHIVALSGYNVTIVAQWIMKFFSYISFVPKNFGIGFGIFSIILFILMTGGSSTAIRAGIMATLALVARWTGRNYDVARALMLACVGMVILNPFVLVYDVSFQLSFLATIAVIFLAPRIEKYFLWVTESFGLRDIVSVTVSAYIFVAPFILYEMGNFSLVALPANVLILPFIPFTMMVGFMTGFIGLIWNGLAILPAYILYFFLHYELGVIGFFSSLPFASLTFPEFPLFLTLLIYAYFVYVLFWRSIMSFFAEEF